MTSYGSARLGERFFEDRAYLLLVYPEKTNKPSKSIYSDKKVKIPFYENPVITETQTPRYATYKLLGRNSDLYSFLGSDSRQISLTFNFTLQHLQHFMKESPWTSKEYLYSKVSKFSVVRAGYQKLTDRRNQRREEINTFNPNFNSSPQQSSIQDYNDMRRNDMAAKLDVESNIQNSVDDYYNQDAIRSVDAIAAYEAEHQELIAKEFGVDIDKYRQNAGKNSGFLSDGLDFMNSLFEQEPAEELMNVKAIFYYYINLLRSTTLGSQELGLGPPVVRLNYGPLYQDVPCLVNKYDISIDNIAGFVKKTLLPNRVKITLSMNEVRLGDLTTHAPEQFGESDDNVATWESIFKYGTIDPRTEARLTSQATMDEFKNQKISDLEGLRSDKIDTDIFNTGED